MPRVARVRFRVRDWTVGACLVAAAGLLAGTLSGGAERPVSDETRTELTVRRLSGVELVVLSPRQSGKRSFSPEQVEGPPDVRQAGDNSQAWASQTTDGQVEWLLCEYENAVQVRAVIVHETFNPGALVKVSAFNPAGDEVVAWEGDDPTPRGKPRGISVIPVKLDFPVQRIKLTIDSPAVPGWNEIDAVGVEDASGVTHWAKHVEASTAFGSPGRPVSPVNVKPSYASSQAAGEPDTPRPGDQGTAWASGSPDNRPEWLVCTFKIAQTAVDIAVYENNAPGAISKVAVFNEEGAEITVWEGLDPTPRDQPWGVSVFPVKVDFPFRKLKLYINSDEVPGYNEVDAVGLRMANGDTQWAAEVQASSTYGTSGPGMQPGMMGPGMPADTGVQALQKEVQALRRQVDELQKLRKELGELKELLKESRK